MILHYDKSRISAEITSVLTVTSVNVELDFVQHQLAAFAGAVYFDLRIRLIFGSPLTVELWFQVVTFAQVAGLTGDRHVGHGRDISKVWWQVSGKSKGVGLAGG